FSSAGVAKTDITFSPHLPAQAKGNLDNMAARIAKEEKQTNGSVLFAVMGLDKASGSVLPALQKLHEDQNIFSYGISDSPGGIQLYTPRKKTGVLVFIDERQLGQAVFRSKRSARCGSGTVWVKNTRCDCRSQATKLIVAMAGV